MRWPCRGCARGGSRGAEGVADRCPLTAASDARTERPTASAWRAAFLPSSNSSPETLVTPDAGKPVQPLAVVGW